MVSYTDFAFPAGDESDASNDEWDISSHSENKTLGNKDLGSPVADGGDNVSVLKKAINGGDAVTVKQLLDNGMDVETNVYYGRTPLMYAVSLANYDIAKLLLDRGASANFSKDHWTVLMASCTASAAEDEIARCVELLLSRSADPNMVDRSQKTCLMLAARDGYTKVINLLVSHGAEINIQDSKGYTALSIAVQHGREEAVLKLLQLGADKTIRTKYGKSPAELAELHKRTQIARILASSSQLSAVPASTSIEEMLSQLFKTNSDAVSKERETKLDELELLLHGLNLGYLTDILAEHDITWSYLFTMDEEDFEKIGITDQVDRQKLLSAVQQMHLDKVDLDKIQLGTGDSGSEDLQNFLLSVGHQCCYLTETLQDVISRFPRQASQLIISLDPKKEAQIACKQLIVQTQDLQKEIICLHNLLCQPKETFDRVEVTQWVMENQVVLEMLQGYLHCCGWTGVEDWSSEIPSSCSCDASNGQEDECKSAPSGLEPSTIYSKSCRDVIWYKVELLLNITLAILFGLLFIPLMGLIIAIIMIYQISLHDSFGGTAMEMRAL